MRVSPRPPGSPGRPRSQSPVPGVPRGRSAITLVEILISILILGVGVVSLATLFPLGLLRLREAARLSRSSFLIESAAGELEARNLFARMSFVGSFWYNPPTVGATYDPWVQDTPLPAAVGTPNAVYRGFGASGSGSNPNGVSFVPGTGLPVAYDPLWWTIVSSDPNTNVVRPNVNGIEARFGSGITQLAPIRNDPNPQAGSPNGSVGSVYGLQRITNFAPLLDNAVQETFVSPEDYIWQTEQGSPIKGASPLVPDLSLSGTTGLVSNDFRYTWMFTGQQTDSSDDAIFNGDVVIFENRPFAIDGGVVAGELVVEAIFGYSKNVIVGVGGKTGYAPQPSQTVLLRWPNTIPDPDVRVGSWIADVTYERFASNSLANQTDAGNAAQALGAVFPSQRCNWYQVSKRTQPGPDPVGGVTNYRAMTVWVSTPLKALTILDSTTKQPYHVNAALVSPYVINVFPRTIYSR